MKGGSHMDKHIETNRDLWDGWARINVKSTFYDVDGFKAGKSSLNPVEIAELGDVSGKSLLHLQCHFGLDTLSWARSGAQVTGVDFSNEAIATAQSLSEELGIIAEFIHSNIYDLPKILDRQFDIVFTSYGALCWLSDIERWAQIVKRSLKAGGTFYMIEFHPIIHVLDYDEGKRFEHSYFYSAEPVEYEAEGSYADGDSHSPHKAYEWTHNLGDVVTALIAAGLKLEFLHEFPFSPYGCFPFVKEYEPGKYMLKDRPNTIPLTYSLRATG